MNVSGLRNRNYLAEGGVRLKFELSPRLLAPTMRAVGNDGFLIRAMPVNGTRAIVIAANRDIGALYGAFHLLRVLQTHQTLEGLTITSAPRVQWRMLDHWDNLDRTVERGYAGASLWDWHTLPDFKAPRYTDYARANASLGINGTCCDTIVR